MPFYCGANGCKETLDNAGYPWSTTGLGQRINPPVAAQFWPPHGMERPFFQSWVPRLTCHAVPVTLHRWAAIRMSSGSSNIPNFFYPQ